MKKFHFLFLMCAFGFITSQAAPIPWYFNGNVSSDITDLNNWSNTYPIASTPHPLPSALTLSTNTWIINTSTAVIAGGATFAVAGNMTISAGAHISVGSGANTLSVGGTFKMQDSAFITSSPFAGPFTLRLYGNLFVNNTAYISTGVSTTYNHIHFSDTTGALRYVSWASTALSQRTALIFDKRSSRTLLTNIPVPQGSDISDSLNGTLFCGTYTMSSSNATAFTINDSAFIHTSHTGGLDSSIQHMSAIHYSKKANYYFDGVVPQVTGLSFPDTISGFLYAQVPVIARGSVTIDSAAGNVTLSKPLYFDKYGRLNLRNGAFTNGSFLTMSDSSAVTVDAGSMVNNPTYAGAVGVFYMNLGANLLAANTSHELTPTVVDSAMFVYVNKTGATITMNSAMNVRSLTLNRGTLDVSASNYDINIISSSYKGGYYNNKFGPLALAPRAGSVNFIGTTYPGVLGGTYGNNFNNLTLNDTAGLQLTKNDTLNNLLTLTAGKFYLQTDTLVLGPAALPVAPGTFSSANMIVDNNPAGQVIKLLSGTGISYLFPIGDTAIVGNSATYSPVTVDFTSSVFDVNCYAAVRVNRGEQPNNTNTTTFLKRYWTLDLENFITPSYSVSAQYAPGDVVGTEANLAMGQWTGVWAKFNAANTTTHTIATGVNITTTGLPNDFTGIDSLKPRLVSSRDTTICQPGGSYTINVTGIVADPVNTFTWAPSLGLSATTGTTVVATPSVTTTYTVTLTDGNGFTGYATTTITVNAAPSVTGITNNSPLCTGDSLILYGNNPLHVAAYSWAGPVSFTTGGSGDTVTVGHAPVAATGIYTLTLTNGPGTNCRVAYTTTVTVNPLPLATVAHGGGTYCDSAVITATNADVNPRIVYFENTIRNGTFTSLPSSSQTVFSSGTYYFRSQNPTTGCWGPQDSVTVVINPLPVQYFFTPLVGGGFFCAGDTGVHIILSGSDTGIAYQLDTAGGIHAGTPVAGTGSAIDFGRYNKAGTYVVSARNVHTGCQFTLMDSVIVSPVGLPSEQPFTGGGGYCFGTTTGVDIALANPSNDSDIYLLYHHGIAVDSFYSSFPAAVDFGNYTDTGIYTVVARDINFGCVSTFSGHDSVFIFPLPNIYHVTGGGQECADGAGVAIGLSASQTGVQYQLYQDGSPGSYSPLPGTGIGAFTFGPVSPSPFPFVPFATFTVIATTDVGACTATMLDSATITVNPLPFDNRVLGTGDLEFCAGQPHSAIITMLASEVNVNYQLSYNGTPLGLPDIGTGSFFNFSSGPFSDTGIYSVTATNTVTGCFTNLADSIRITQRPYPVKYTLSGTGSFCNTTTGIDLTLSSSQTGVNYQLWDSTAIPGSSFMVGTFHTGTGAAIDFGPQSDSGTFYVVGTTFTYGVACADTMDGSSHVVVLPLPIVYNVTGTAQSCAPGVTHPIGLDGSETSVSYQLYRNDTAVVSQVGPGGPFSFGSYLTPGTYTVAATRIATGCKDSMTGRADIVINPLPVVYHVGGGGVYCHGTPGAPDSLLGSETGVSYQLYNYHVAVPGAVVTGSGFPITFGYDTAAGHYTVVATNITTGCTSLMLDSAVNVSNPLPVVYSVAGGGNYCIGGTGRHVYLDGSNLGKHYLLFRDATLLDSLRGTGFGLDYGSFTTAGNYTVIAVDTVLSTRCSSIMGRTVSIGISPLPVAHTVSGDSTFCASAPGAPVNLSGSASGVRYYLYNGTSVVDSLNGTGAALHYSLRHASGTYTVSALDLRSLCTSNMTGAAHITVNPLPRIDTITGGGAYCAGDTGVLLGQNSSSIGVTYQLYLGSSPIGGPLVGTGGPLNYGPKTLAGFYTIYSIFSSSRCGDSVHGSKEVIINPLPSLHTVTGGGTYCSSDSGLHVGLDGSDTGIAYQLYNIHGLAGTPLAGMGGPLDFGLDTTRGAYHVKALNNNTGCADTMSGAVNINVVNYFVPVVTIRAFPDTLVLVGYPDTLVAVVSGGAGLGATYQWYVNGHPIYDAISDTFHYAVYFNNDTISCHVTSTGPCGGVTTTSYIVIKLQADAVKQVALTGADLRLMPNPNKGAFTLKGTVGTGNEDVQVEVTNMLGQTVYKNSITARNGVVDEHIQLSSNLANGMYLLSLHSAAGSSIIHFAVEQ